MSRPLPLLTRPPTPVTVAPQPRRSGKPIFGLAAVLLAISGSRWGSYLGVEPLYLTDLLIICGLIHWAFSRPASKPETLPSARSAERSAALVAFFVFVVVRLGWQMHVDLGVLRDAVPYLYCGLGLLTASTVARADAERRHDAGRVLLWALRIHAGWFFLVEVIVPGLETRMPVVSSEQALTVFSVRSDWDVPVTAIFACWLLFQAMRGHRPGWSMIGFVACWVAIMNAPSRAGAIGGICATLLVLLAGLAGRRVGESRKFIAVALMPIALAAVAMVLPQTTFGEEMGALFGAQDTTLARTAAGTAEDRQNAWDRLIEYSLESRARMAGGVGFGPNFLEDSGARELLVHEGADFRGPVRSPHNFWLTTLLRTGILGASLFAVLILTLLRRIRRLIPVLAEEPLLLFSALIVVAAIVPFTFGVILESPFAAVPFYWAAGVVLGYPSDKINVSSSDTTDSPFGAGLS